MAAIYCRVPGIISDNEGQPLPREFIAHELHCSLEVLNSVISKGSQDNCLCDTMNGLQLVNFEHYQFTEYDRQKPYREARRERERLQMSAEDLVRANQENDERIAAHKKAKGGGDNGGTIDDGGPGE